ncbi:MAG: hypothetical protein WKG32_22260 [Gemmatimonadaceae bacterium]
MSRAPRLLRVALTLAAAVAVSVAAACRSSSSPEQGTPSVSARATGSAFQFTNRTTREIFYFIVERKSAALVDWAPCLAPRCENGIAPGATATIRYADVVGYAPGEREALFYWWHAVPGPNGLVADSIRHRVLRF